MAARVPLRRCAGCGRRAPKSELVRLAFAEAQPRSGRPRVILDPRARMPGRGAYICASQTDGGLAAECFTSARARGGIARALRSAVTIDPELVESIDQ